MVDNMADSDKQNRMAEVFLTAPDGLDISDEEADDHKHSKLLQAISSLGGTKRVAPQQRTEAAATASEFNLISQGDKVQLSELVGTLKKTSNHGPLKKQLNRLHYQNKTLETPLPKFQADQMERVVAHEKVSKEVAKWDSIVKKHRKADHLEFPLERPDVRMQTMGQISKTFKIKTPFELEVEKLLGGSKDVLSDTKELTPAEEEALKAMSIEEAQRRRAELQKHRALLSYKASKARRQNKIKSKRYHRILRKEKLKTEKKEMEDLKQKDPTAYADVLLRMHKDHIQERMSLKHRGGSKFMARQKIYGKFDEKNRQAVADMLEKSKELKQKVVLESSSEEEKEDEDKDSITQPSGCSVGTSETSSSSNNPWMKAVSIKRASKTSQYSKPKPVKAVPESDENSSDGEDQELDEIRTKSKENNTKTDFSVEEQVDMDDSDSGDEPSKLSHPQIQDVGIEDIFNVIEKPELKESTKTPTQQKGKVKQKNRKKKKRKEGKEGKKSSGRNYEHSESESEFCDSDLDGQTAMEDAREESANKQKQREGFKGSLKRKQKLEDFDEALSDDEEEDVLRESRNCEMAESSDMTGDVEVDPTKFVTVETRIKSKIAPDLITDADDMDGDDQEQQRLTIAQAFASDDVVEEFHVEKERVQEEDKPKDIDLTLPGWGEWGGSATKVSKWKKKRFVIKAPEAPPRKDRALNHVIISESKDSAIAKHQVTQIPFPFTSVRQFESSVRAPIGKTWNPETSFKTLIKPRVTTRKGTIIDPIDPSHVFKKKESTGLPEEEKTGSQKQGSGKGNKRQGSSGKESRGSANKPKRKRKK